ERDMPSPATGASIRGPGRRRRAKATLNRPAPALAKRGGPTTVERAMTAKFETWDNPMGTAGFEFIEYTAPDPVALGKVFESLGFKAIARHRNKNVTLYRQGGINFLINAEPDSFAQRFARLHGPSICAIAFRVDDAAKAYKRAI